MEKDLKELLDEQKLEENFHDSLNEFKGKAIPDNDLIEIALSAQITHTFGKEENWGTGRRFPYQDVLFKDKAILSQDSRHFEHGEPKQNHGKAKAFDCFVFGYLGAHEHYYARNRSSGISVPAFGVFLSKSAESLEGANATKYDLTSECSGDDITKEFLKPDDARKYTAYKISNNHKDNFWRYWGAHDLAKRAKGYLNNCWIWKTEFHYLKRVDLKYVDAILWPFNLLSISKGVKVRDSIVQEEIRKFRTNHKSIMVYPYPWNLKQCHLRFLHASNIVTNFYKKNKTLPSDEDFALEFYKVYSE